MTDQPNAYKPEDLRNAFGFLYPDEVGFLRKLARELGQQPVIVNIGAGAGTSTSTFLHERLDAKVYSVDIQHDGSPFGSLEGEQTALAEMGLLDAGRYFPITGPSHDVGRNWPNGLVDCIFIDADHTYKGCFGDILLWLPHLKSGGTIIVHDFDKWEKQYPGVDMAVRHLLVDKLDFIAQVDSTVAFKNVPSEHPAPISHKADVSIEKMREVEAQFRK